MIEVRILDRIKHADVGNGANTVKIHESFHFRQHLCITFELLSMNLYEFIKSNNFRGFSVGLIRRQASHDDYLFLDIIVNHADLPFKY
jgi:dual specificity tyrosine-phosphorylation-regulated kinase 2/3/4